MKNHCKGDYFFVKRQTLWTYDYTVITIGSFISLVGNALSNFALSLLVLDYTG